MMKSKEMERCAVRSAREICSTNGGAAVSRSIQATKGKIVKSFISRDKLAQRTIASRHTGYAIPFDVGSMH